MPSILKILEDWLDGKPKKFLPSYQGLKVYRCHCGHVFTEDQRKYSVHRGCLNCNTSFEDMKEEMI